MKRSPQISIRKNLRLAKYFFGKELRSKGLYTTNIIGVKCIKKADLILLIETVYDLAKQGYKFSQKTDKELLSEYSELSKCESTYAFRCGWLEVDLRDIVKVIESTEFYKEFPFQL